jgi:acid phosphatase type 7
MLAWGRARGRSAVAIAVAVALAVGVAVRGATRSAAEPTPDPVIAAAGDISCDPVMAWSRTMCHQLETAALLADSGLTAVLVLGDNQYEDGAYAAYIERYEPSWGRVKSITKPVPGNHEYQTPGATGYFDYFGPVAGSRDAGYYSYDVGAWHLIALNSNCGPVRGCGAGTREERWLREDLAAHPAKCVLAYWHHPRYSSGGYDWGSKYEAFWNALYAADADVVLVGHDHHYERFAPQAAAAVADPVRGIRQFIVGTGGKSHSRIRTIQPNSEVRNADTFGVLKLTLHPDSYEWTFVPEAGGSFTDSGSAACH